MNKWKDCVFIFFWKACGQSVEEGFWIQFLCLSNSLCFCSAISTVLVLGSYDNCFCWSSFIKFCSELLKILLKNLPRVVAI